MLSVTQAVADALGVELAEIHKLDTHKAIDEMARQAGEDSMEYFRRYVLDNKEEDQKWMQSRRERQLRTIGILWNDTPEK